MTECEYEENGICVHPRLPYRKCVIKGNENAYCSRFKERVGFDIPCDSVVDMTGED